MNYKMQKQILLTTFLFVPLMMLFAFLIYPTFKLVLMSFTNWDGVMPHFRWVGWSNYQAVFETPEVWLSLKNNGIYFLNGLVQNALALMFAVILASKLRGRNLFKATLFLPYIINSAAIAFMFNYIFDFERGPINYILVALHLEPIRFLSDADIVTFSLAGVSLWRYFGFTMVIYLAALQSIPNELYESAKVDGANAWKLFRYITLPSIHRIIELNLFLTLSGSLRAFEEAWVMTNKGGPGYASSTFMTYIMRSAFDFNNYAFAAALSIVLLVMVVIATLIQRKLVLRS